MKTSTKLLIIVAVSVCLLSICAVCTWRERDTYHNEKLVKIAYEYWEIEEKMGKAARVFLPELASEDLKFFEGYKLYPYVLRYLKSHEMFAGVTCKQGGEYLFEVRYYLPESSTSGTIGICKVWVYPDYCKYSSCYIWWESRDLLKIIEENFGRRLACYELRKGQEKEFMQESQELGPRLVHINEVLGECTEVIRKSTKIDKGCYSFTVSSERFGHIICTIFYDPDPMLEVVRIELDKSPVGKCFDVGYEKNYKQGCVWGFINNEDVKLESFGVILDALDSVEAEITKDPNIVKAALEKSVK